MTSVTTAHPKASPQAIFGAADAPETQDLEQRLLLVLSIVDHRIATRDRYDGPARDAHIEQAYAEARAALDGASIDQILEARQ